MYLWTKLFHVLFVIAWMATVFYLPRFLVNLAEVGEQPAVRERLALMGKRLYRFGHVMFGIAFVLGLTLWMHFDRSGGWLHAKLTVVALMLAHFIITGRWLKRAAAGGALPSPTTLRWYNEIPLLLTIAILWLVYFKPF
ncbi:CopD family protein [Arenimonas donghaensis]|uniref:Protoporphyrinogen IX oxidase n=1 Tax=Arenimonas donghaensis DSM 18148 = HO3-R19 TaxID=1121014 RepID=A0A087MIY7_9GAMM|nr:CopD family protein [Arenimonas donghaensis]KFL36840.1 hypothetical protein N788_04280 [Arenimonas donghaensis DSM 18148 = HO3-R19]